MRIPCPDFYRRRFRYENKLKRLISENEGFCQEINADQRHGSFSANFQLVLDRNKLTRSFLRRNENYPKKLFSAQMGQAKNRYAICMHGTTSSMDDFQ
jgi:hypothetical protein